MVSVATRPQNKKFDMPGRFTYSSASESSKSNRKPVVAVAGAAVNTNPNNGQ